jgi:hypothetical protein
MELFAGIDVAKEAIDVFVPPDNIRKSFANNDEGRVELPRVLAKMQPALILLAGNGQESS